MGYRSSRHIYFGGSSKLVRVWDRSEQKIQNVLSGHHARITSIALTTDDQRIASASLTGDVMIHSLKHGTRSNLNSPFKQVSIVLLNLILKDSEPNPILSVQKVNLVGSGRRWIDCVVGYSSKIGALAVQKRCTSRTYYWCCIRPL